VISSDGEAFAGAGIEESNEAQSLPANLGELRPTRWLISTILRHDTYHAGEINHIRGLLVEDGRWRWG
jgi:hypothetical protein